MTDTLKYTERDMVTASRTAAALARCQFRHSRDGIPCQECVDFANRAYPMPTRRIPRVLDDPDKDSSYYHFRVNPNSSEEIQCRLKTEGEDKWKPAGLWEPTAERVRVWFDLLEHPALEVEELLEHPMVEADEFHGRP